MKTFSSVLYSVHTCHDALLIHCQENRVKMAQWLFGHGASQDFSTEMNDGYTAMYIASQNNHLNMVQWLIDHGASSQDATLLKPFPQIVKIKIWVLLVVVVVVVVAAATLTKNK